MIRPDFLYEESELQAHLAGAFDALILARRDKTIRHIFSHHSTFYLGSWIIEWLTAAGQVDPEVAKPAKPQPAAPKS